MKSLKKRYIVPILFSLLVAMVLIYVLFPVADYLKAIFVFIIPASILVIWFRQISLQRIQIIRHQLNQIINTLEAFDVDEPNKVAFEDSPFPILNELNVYQIELIDRIRSDYLANKQFTQNASHELQTPLAIIKGHIELLLQSPNLKEKEIQSLAVVLQNTNRLSKLNSALILLSKIEHQRFVDTEVVDFAEVTEEILKNFEDLIGIQGVAIRKLFKGNFKVEMSYTLAEILIANLVQNAIRHNIEGGFIEIEISDQRFSISNPGGSLDVNPKHLFKRFRRKSNVEESLGLGLSIVKRICEQSNLEVDYHYEEGIHTLLVVKCNS